MTTELLPCPFCGEGPHQQQGAHVNNYIRCSTRECPIFDVKFETIFTWNTRAPAPVTDEARKAALEALDGDYATLKQPDGTFRLDSWKFMRAMVEHSETIRSALSSPAAICKAEYADAILAANGDRGKIGAIVAQERFDAFREGRDSNRPAWRDISTFDSRMFSLMTDGTPDGTEVVKYKGEVPGWATKWMPLPGDAV